MNTFDMINKSVQVLWGIIKVVNTIDKLNQADAKTAETGGTCFDKMAVAKDGALVCINAAEIYYLKTDPKAPLVTLKTYEVGIRALGYPIDLMRGVRDYIAAESETEKMHAFEDKILAPFLAIGQSVLERELHLAQENYPGKQKNFRKKELESVRSLLTCVMGLNTAAQVGLFAKTLSLASREESSAIDLSTIPSIPERFHGDSFFQSYTCPISKEPIRFVVVSRNGIPYERDAVKNWLSLQGSVKEEDELFGEEDFSESPELQQQIEEKLIQKITEETEEQEQLLQQAIENLEHAQEAREDINWERLTPLLEQIDQAIQQEEVEA